MLIAGLRKTSLVDYPGKLAAVVFTPYCNMRCSYCHNRHILGGTPLISEGEVLDFLTLRRGQLDAVVVSGGEPTMRPDLPDFILRVKELGYLVKLDTNGTHPAMLLELIEGGMLDYVAMDIKAPFDKYRMITGTTDDIAAIERSLTVLRSTGIAFELRTTFAPQLSIGDIEQIAREIAPAGRYFVQQYIPRDDADPPPHTRAELRRAAEAAREILGFCEERN